MLRLKSIDELKGKHVRDSAMRETGLHLERAISGSVRGKVGSVAATDSAPGVSDRHGEAARERGHREVEGGHRNTVARGAIRESGMNKLEAAYAQHLDALQYAGAVIWWRYEAVGLRLADRTFYHPDFLVMMADGTLEAHETKGFMRDDANVKLKVAASAFPFVFRLVKKQKGGAWDIRTI